jgi:hypothetical protein
MPPPDPFPSPTQRKADLDQLMKGMDAGSRESAPTPDPAEHAETKRQRRFDDFDRYDGMMGTAASIVVGALTVAFLMWRFSFSFFGALVIGFLWGGLIYAVCGWEREKRRNRRLERRDSV